MTLPRALRIAVAVALTGYILFKSNPAAVARVAGNARVSWLLVAVLLVIVDRAANAYRWVVLLQTLTPGTRPPVRAVMHVFFVSSFVGTFLPSVGGDVYRAYQLARLGVRSGEAAASVLMDRMVGVLSMVMVAAVALLFLREFDLPGVVPALLAVTAVCAVAAGAVFSSNVAALAVRLFDRLPVRWARSVAQSLTDAIHRYGRHHGALALVLALSVGVQLLRIVQAYCLGRALDLTLPMIVYFGFIPVITLVMQVPITVAGLGTTQYAFEWMFGHAGVTPAVTFALSMLFLALGTLGNLPGGLLYVFSARTSSDDRAP